MRKIIIALALLIFGAVGQPSLAAVGHRFVTGMNDNRALAQMMRVSLAKDPSGHSAVDPVGCARPSFRGCATLQDFLDQFLKADADSGLKNVADLPAYVESLVIKTAPQGRYWMACKTEDGGVNSPTKWDCLTRAFHAGEPGYANPKTGRIVLAKDCGNPVGKTEQETDCVELNAWLKPGDEIHYGWLKAAFPQGKCPVLLQKAGDDERGSPALDECPLTKCDFSGPARDLGGVRVYDTPRISYVAKVEGWHTLRLPKEVLATEGFFVLCVVRPDGRQTHGKPVYGKLGIASSFVGGKAYVTYDNRRSAVPTSWKGKPYTWLFMDGRTD